MPRIKRTGKLTRLNLQMSRETQALLLGLRDRTNADSLSEVVRRALFVYSWAVRTQERGEEIVATGKDRRIVRLLL